MRYQSRRSYVEAMTFDEFVQYGIDNGGNIVSGMPWSFTFNGFPVTHENNNLYLITTRKETLRFPRNCMIVWNILGDIGIMDANLFHVMYELEREA